MKTKLLLCGVMLFAAIAFNSCKPSDEELKKAVNTSLNALPSTISSDVKKGEATLSGIVESDELKAEAEKLVKDVKGIKSVVNNIEVKQPEPEPVINPDTVLSSTISSLIAAGGDAFKQVIVNVKDGEVTLTGSVKKADLQKVMQIVNEAKPKKVNNLLNIIK
ncbi:MAG: BON domain-containing protein [Dysgonamonadaceae bacterium]|jgi:osmotically-inducible protein OsmY|nr:BON domain-containing protein [Dysgonamonadaceae bacterium]